MLILLLKLLHSNFFVSILPLLQCQFFKLTQLHSNCAGFDISTVTLSMVLVLILTVLRSQVFWF